MNPEKKTSCLIAGLLWLAALAGTVMVLPYLASLDPGRLQSAARAVDGSTATVVALSVLQSAIVLGVIVPAGLWAAGRLGLGLPLLAAVLGGRPAPFPPGRATIAAAAAGAIGAAAIIALDRLVFGSVASALAQAAAVPPWQGLLASFYGGITEEVQLRLFLLSFLALGARRIYRCWHPAGDEALPPVVFWTANIAAALLFGLAHLPVTADLVAITPLVVVRALVLNGILGGIAGYLFYRRGLEMAMICHFTADVLLHALLPLAG